MACTTGSTLPPQAWDIPARPANCAAGQCCTGIGGADEPDVWYLADERPSHPKAIQVYQMVPPRAKFLNNDSDGTVMKDNKYYYIGEAHGVAAVVGAWWIARFEPV